MSKPKLTLGMGNSLSASKIAMDAGLDSIPSALGAMERASYEHYANFGTQPFSITFDTRHREYVISANAVIGLVDCGAFIVEIMPKVPNLSVGKCLHMAHRCQMLSLVRHTNKIVEESLNDALSLSGIEHFAVAFLSVVTDLEMNALLREPAFREGPDPDLRGSLRASEHISHGCNPLAPFTRRPTTTLDIPVNRTLKATLQRCQSRSEDATVKGLATRALLLFNEVSDLGPAETPTYEYASSIRRDDYQRAIALARIILEGFDPLEGDGTSFMPHFTIDLDVLFEKFVVAELRKALDSDIYAIYDQQSHAHPIEPNRGRTIKPDIVVQERAVDCGIVLDTKNKYSKLSEQGVMTASNEDLFQIAYYALTLSARTVVLIYPGNESNSTSFPLKGSDGADAHTAKKTRALHRIQADPTQYLRFRFPIGGGTHDVGLYLWRVNVAGTMRDTLKSVAELAYFTTEGVKERA